jgi:hypothetical protein
VIFVLPISDDLRRGPPTMKAMAAHLEEVGYTSEMQFHLLHLFLFIIICYFKNKLVSDK